MAEVHHSDLKGCIACIDDICVYGRSLEEHLHNSHKALTRLNSLNLGLNLRKCVFSTAEIEFFGYVILSAGVRPTLENTRAILGCLKPANVTQVKHFLGLCSYHLGHLQNFATISEPLRKLTRANMEYVRSLEQKTAYTRVQILIASTPDVTIFDENCPTYVSTDASDVGLSDVLSQLQNGEEKVITYAFRTLSSTERNYFTSEKEALACVWAC